MNKKEQAQLIALEKVRLMPYCPGNFEKRFITNLNRQRKQNPTKPLTYEQKKALAHLVFTYRSQLISLDNPGFEIPFDKPLLPKKPETKRIIQTSFDYG